MYSELLSLAEAIRSHQCSEDNVLRSFPSSVGREVVSPVIRSLQEIILGKNFGDTDTPLSLPSQVQWVMETVGHGLTLPLSELTLLTGCVDVYHDWLSALYFQKHTVPLPILNDPNHYAQIIFDQFCSLFVPRETEPRLLEEHAFLCKKVIEMVHTLMTVKGLRMSRDTWGSLFTFLLHVCDLLLSPPARTPGLGTTLCEALIHALFTAWLRACQDTFPSPNLWKTLRELCCHWRHHSHLIRQWSSLMYSLSFQVITHLYGTKHLSILTPLPAQDNDFFPLIKDMGFGLSVQCWFRMLHTLGNPVDLLHPDVITGTPAFRQFINETSPDSLLQRCVSQLPVIFESIMKGIALQVNLFLGHRLSSSHRNSDGYLLKSDSISRNSPSVRRREGIKDTSKSTFFIPSPQQLSRQTTVPPTASDAIYVNFSPDKRSPPFAGMESPLGRGIEGIIGKPRGNTLLHIFGNWLFEASSWTGRDREGISAHVNEGKSKSVGDLPRIQELSSDLSTGLKDRMISYEPGRAEAIGCLCAIFSHMPCGEDVLRIYLARFYHSLSACLNYNPETCRGHVLIRTILGSVTLLRKDLPGINVLVPQFLSSLEKILPVETPPFRCDIQLDRLRKASIQILLSILPLPLHFVHLKIPDVQTILRSVSTLHSSSSTQVTTFYSLKNTVLNLILAAMETEKDSSNMNMLIHGLNVYIHDVILYEYSLSKMLTAQGEGGEEKTANVNLDDQEGISQTTNDYPLTTIFREVAESAHQALMKWSNTNEVTLAALELLSGLARLQFDVLSHNDCRDTVQWVCDFIEKQSQLKPYLQTKSLHTSIVAGFTTLIVWIMEHPHLLAHEACLASILRVTEFGMTGSFSKSEDGTTILKGDKKLKPVSGRVGEIADFLFYCTMEKFGSFPSPCGAAASGSLLTEEELIKQLAVTGEKPTPKFQYYLVDNSLILGLLEGAYSDKEGTLPTVTGIIRGPASRQVWTVQLRHSPRSDTTCNNNNLRSQPRPNPSDAPPTQPNLLRPPWPSAANISELKLLQSIPTLDEVIDESSAPLYREFSQLTSQQITVESSIQSQLQQSQAQKPFPDPSRALEPPEVKTDFDTARLFLSHMGLLNMESLQAQPGSPSLVMLDSSSLHFRSSLSALDRMLTRYCNTVFVVYCKKGQNKVEDILNNQLSLQNKPQEYVQFMNGLGWLVDPLKHPGFAGKLRPDIDEGTPHRIGLNAQIPLRPFPYFADAITEIAFVTPTRHSSANESVSSVRSVDSSDSGPDSTTGGGNEPYPTLSSVPTWSAPLGSGVSKSPVTAGDVGGIKPMRSSTSQSSTNVSGGGASQVTESSDTPRRRLAPPRDCATLVVWLECFEDHMSFPIESMSKVLYKTNNGLGKTGGGSSISTLPVVFVHRLSSGLYQIMTRSGSTAGPLIDGMVVSKRSLSNLVRQTVINLCTRHRMECEGYSPPHVKRKRKIEEMAGNFTRRLTPAEFCSELIINSPN